MDAQCGIPVINLYNDIALNFDIWRLSSSRNLSLFYTFHHNSVVQKLRIK